ncbi:hypothetical protein [uncultured Enterovirga sp.]|uniref:hypothetical protein n=1 Tax=uncultured Enterovirga sp. TaxID=2026352 RepID=UPI0035CA2F26
MLRGYVDKAEGEIHGWAFDDERPEIAVQLDVYIGGRFFRRITADQARQDLSILATGNINYGFSIRDVPSVRPDDIVFAKYKGAFVVQSPSALKSHLFDSLNHVAVLESLGSNRTVTYCGPVDDGVLDIAGRIVGALQTAETVSTDYGPLWGLLVKSHGEFLALARDSAVAELAQYLADVGRRPLSTGFFDGPAAYEGAESNAAFRNAAATLIFDRLLSLAEAMGCVAVENPEQGRRGVHSTAEPSALLDAVAATLSVPSLKAPVGGYWGLSTTHGVVNVRALDAMYAAWRLDVLRRQYGTTGISEIGGGVGLVAHYAALLGAFPYQIVDLPTVGAAQAFTLRHHSDLRLYGEDQAGGRLTLIPPWEFGASDKGGREFLFNMDSLPEIETAAAIKYLSDARSLGFRYFLSINQESGWTIGEWSQNKVSDLVKQAGGYILLSRHRNWMRPGYVEELYAIAGRS